MSNQDDGGVTVVARIDAYGGAELLVNGSPSRARLASIEDARLYVGQHALDLAAQLGREVVLDTSDPAGAWLFVARPDGSMVETTQPRDGSGPEPVPPAAPDAEEDDVPPAPAEAPVPSASPARADPAPAAPAAAVPAPAAPPQEAPPNHTWGGPQPWTPTAPGGEHAPARAWSPQPTAPQAPATPYASPPPVPAPPAAQPRRAVPTLDDLLGGRPAPLPGPAQTGWQAFVRKATFGLVKPGPGPQELRYREAVATIQRSLPGPRTVVVVNPKGGASKTTATMLLAATFATLRGGYTLAWDNNETRGTLGWRAVPARHHNTAVDLLADLERFQQVRGARVGDLDNYVRTQGAAQFDVLASDEDPAASASIDADAFQRLHGTLSRFYRILVIDTGNNMRASNWEAAVAAADQLVIVSTIREDTAASAAWLVDGLRAKGHGDKVEHAVTILSAPASSNDAALSARLHDHFTQLTRAVVDVPHEQSLVAGGPIDFAALSKPSRDAWVLATAKVAEGL
jgi:MinD-like ATPase involved in chromosome partitioning or flagellar assembly